MTARFGVGADWASGAWVVVTVREGDGEPTARVEPDIAAVVEAAPDGAEVVADVPIGLCRGSEGRSCDCHCRHDDGECSRLVDTVARSLISPRASSVFTPPCRGVVERIEELEYGDANELNRERTGKGLMQQTYYIADAIAQVDDYLREQPADSDPVLEGHPEVCFCALGDWEPLEHGKFDARGVRERLDRLETVEDYNRGEWRPAVETLTIADEVADPDLGLDDLLDAFALAVTACGWAGDRLPVDGPVDEELLDRVGTDPERAEVSTDSEGLPMQMVFREPT